MPKGPEIVQRRLGRGRGGRTSMIKSVEDPPI
jgi:hypothetical protein